MTNEMESHKKKATYYILDTCTRCGRCAQKCQLHALVPRQGHYRIDLRFAMAAESVMRSVRSGRWPREAKRISSEKMNGSRAGS